MCKNGDWWIKDGDNNVGSLTGTWVDISSIKGQEKFSDEINKDLLEKRIHMKFDFKGIELKEKDQFKVGSKIFEIAFFMENCN